MKQSFFIFILLITSFLHAEEYHFSGVHYMASYSECDSEALRNFANLQNAMALGVHEAGATLLSATEYVFPPEAITMVMLLSESHASIHTYPEYNACYVDLFTCGESCDYKQFEKVLCEYLKPANIDSQILKR